MFSHRNVKQGEKRTQWKTVRRPRKTIHREQFCGLAHAKSANDLDAAMHHATIIRVMRKAIVGEAND
jgi:hypothetical protein